MVSLRVATVHSAHPHQQNPPLHQRHKLNICVRKEHLKCLHLGIFIPAAIYNGCKTLLKYLYVKHKTRVILLVPHPCT